MEKETTYNNYVDSKNSWMEISIIAIFCMLLLAGMASAGIVVNVIPDSINIQPGGNVTCQIKIQSISNETESGVLSIQDPIAGWSYSFDHPEFRIAPGGINITNLHIAAPETAFQGIYQYNVSVIAKVPDYEEFTEETSFFSFVVVIGSIPPIIEFPTIMLTGLGVYCLLFMMHRKMKKWGVV